MPTLLQAVDVPERCFLHEALLWIAFQRLPTAIYNELSQEIREETNDGYKVGSPEGPLTEEECKRAGIPVDPALVRLLETPRPLPHYDDLVEKHGHDETMRRLKEAIDKEDEEYERACAQWRPYYDDVIEYPASQLFVALKSGQLRATGRQLTSVDYDRAMEALKVQERFLGDLPLQEIPSSFWTLKGIHFESSAAQNEKDHYCHIALRTADVLAVFPGERQEVTVERIGDTFVLKESAMKPPRAARGRPPYPWDPFHLEVAAVLKRNELPAKKEAAIEYFQSWFFHEFKIRPSRAAIGEKLTPYYDTFIRGVGQKT